MSAVVNEAVMVKASLSDWSGEWVHYSKIPEVKINPKQFHQDPAGIYLFPNEFKTSGTWETTYPYKFRVTLKPNLNVLDLSKLTTQSILELAHKLIPLDDKFHEGFAEWLATVPNPVDAFWDQLKNHFVLKVGAAGVGAWNKALRDAGYDAVFDDTQAIHVSEVQMLVLDPTAIQSTELIEDETSVFDIATEVMAYVVTLCEPFGEVTATGPKKVTRYGETYLQGTISIQQGDDHATWTVTPRQLKNEVKPSDILVSLSGDSKNLKWLKGMSIGESLKLPDWKLELPGLSKTVTKTMQEIFPVEEAVESSRDWVAPEPYEGLHPMDDPNANVGTITGRPGWREELPGDDRRAFGGVARTLKFKDYDVETYREKEHDDYFDVDIYGPGRELIGSLEVIPELVEPEEGENPNFLVNSKEFAKVWNVWVHEKFRRQGLATEMYRLAEKELGKKLSGGDVQTDQGQAFRKSLTAKLDFKQKQTADGFSIDLTKEGKRAGFINIRQATPDMFLDGVKTPTKKTINKYPELVEIVDIKINSTYQEKGLGFKLLQKGLQEIKKNYPGLPVIINAAPMGDISLYALVSFYEKAGFKQIESNRDNSIMWLEPSKVKADVTAALQFKTQPTVWNGNTTLDRGVMVDGKIYEIDQDPTAWLNKYANIPEPEIAKQLEESGDVPIDLFRVYRPIFVEDLEFTSYDMQDPEVFQDFVLKVLLKRNPIPKSFMYHTLRPEKSRKVLVQDFLKKGQKSLASADSNTWYHLTDNAKFKLDPQYSPEDNSIAVNYRGGQPGIYLAKDIEVWVNGHNYWRPFVVEFKVDASVSKDTGVHGRYHGEMFVPASSFDKIEIQRVIPLDAYAREKFGGHGWIESETGRAFDTNESFQYKPWERPFHNWTYQGPDVREMPAPEINRLKKDLKQVKGNVTASASYSNWVKPTDEQIAQEYEWEYKNKTKHRYGDIWPTLEDFEKAIKAAKTQRVSDSTYIGNTTDFGSLEELEDFVQGYQFPRDVRRIVQGFESNAAMPMPLVLKTHNGLQIMSGNTRLNVARILGIEPVVLVLEIKKKKITSATNRLEQLSPTALDALCEFIAGVDFTYKDAMTAEVTEELKPFRMKKSRRLYRGHAQPSVEGIPAWNSTYQFKSGEVSSWTYDHNTANNFAQAEAYGYTLEHTFNPEDTVFDYMELTHEEKAFIQKKIKKDFGVSRTAYEGEVMVMPGSYGCEVIMTYGVDDDVVESTTEVIVGSQRAVAKATLPEGSELLEFYYMADAEGWREEQLEESAREWDGMSEAERKGWIPTLISHGLGKHFPHNPKTKEEWNEVKYAYQSYYENQAQEDANTSETFFEKAKIITNPTLIRFTDYPEKVLTEGFEGHGPRNLGLTTQGMRPGLGDLAFAFDKKDLKTPKDYEHASSYGNFAFEFKVPYAVKAYHNSDGEWQVVFDVNTVTNLKKLDLEFLKRKNSSRKTQYLEEIAHMSLDELNVAIKEYNALPKSKKSLSIEDALSARRKYFIKLRKFLNKTKTASSATPLESGAHGDWKSHGIKVDFYTIVELEKLYPDQYQDESFDYASVATDRSGTIVGIAKFSEVGNWLVPYSVEVSRNLRRLGIATELYDIAERESGKKITPDEDQTEAAKAFWKSRRTHGGLQGDWKKEGYEIHESGPVDFTDADDGEAEAFMQANPDLRPVDYGITSPEGEAVGDARIGLTKDRKNIYVWDINIEPEHRRKGLASALYKQAEKDFGKKLKPGVSGLSEDSKALWNQPKRSFGASEEARFRYRLDKKDGDMDLEIFDKETGDTAGSAYAVPMPDDMFELEFEDLLDQPIYQQISEYPLLINLQSLSVDEKYRGQGLSKKIMNLLLKKIISLYPDTPIYLNASPMGGDMNHLQLADFYKRFGFKPIKDYGPNMTMWMETPASQLRQVACLEEAED